MGLQRVATLTTTTIDHGQSVSKFAQQFYATNGMCGITYQRRTKLDGKEAEKGTMPVRNRVGTKIEGALSNSVSK
jgi:hypothetical protein